MTELEFVEENRQLLCDIVSTIKKYQADGNWNALTRMAQALNAAAQVIIEDVMTFGYIKKELTLEDIIKH